MVDHAQRYRPYDADAKPYDDGPYEEKPADRPVASYPVGPSVRSYQERSVPLFLSDRDGVPDPSEYMSSFSRKHGLSRKHGMYYASRILAGAFGGIVIAIVAALFSSSDSGREFIAGAKASSAAVFSAASAAMQPNPTPKQVTVAELPPPPPVQPVVPESPAVAAGGVMVAAVAPTHDDIKTEPQSALQGSTPPTVAAPEPAPQATTPQALAPQGLTPQALAPQAVAPQDTIRRLDADELAALLKRADSLMASGDVAAARLVLVRAAEAGDGHAAMLLGGSYDPSVLEKERVRGVVPDLAMARSWYEKAKQFGAPEATARLELLAKKQN
jgi:hypothetical protein